MADSDSTETEIKLRLRYPGASRGATRPLDSK